MPETRRTFTPEFKFRVAIESIMQVETLNELAVKFKVEISQIGIWKKELLTRGPEIFKRKRTVKIPFVDIEGDPNRQTYELNLDDTEEEIQ